MKRLRTEISKHLLGFLYIICVIVPNTLLAQGFQHFTVDDGIPSNEVYDVIQDKTGKFWIATDRGLSIYDGYRFVNYTTEDGLPDNTIFGFEMDGKGRIWFQTFNGNLGCYHEGKFNQIHSFETADNMLELILINDSTIQCMFYKNGVYEFGVNKESQLVYSKKINDDIVVFWQEKIKKAGISGFSENPPKDFLPIRILQKDISKALSHKFNWLNSKVVDLRNKCIAIPQSQSLFLVGHSEGVNVYNNPNDLLLIDSLHFDGTISNIYLDQWDGLWVTTSDKGLYYQTDLNVSLVKQSKLDNYLHYYSENSFNYIATQSELKIEYNNKELYFNGLGNILDVQKVGDMVYFEADGLNIVSLQNLKLNRTKGGYKFKFQDNKIWAIVHGYSGVAMYNPGELNPSISYPNNLGKIRYRSLCKTSDSLVLAPLTGLHVLDLNSKKYKKLDLGKELNQTRFVDLENFKKDLLVGATRGKGLILFKNNKIHYINQSHGIGSDLINSITCENDTIWIASIKGLSKLVIESLVPLKFSIQNYTSSNGVYSNFIHSISLDKRYIFLCTNNGVVKIPRNLKIKKRAPFIHFEGILNDGVVWDNDQPLKLEFFNNSITFQYTGILISDDPIYYYRLVGLNNKWVKSFDRSPVFIGLEDGEYTFECYAQNPDDGSVSETIRYKFEVKKPYWKQWWFLFLVSGLIIIFAGIFWFLLRRRTFRKIQLKYELFRLENKAARAQLNPHFVFNALNSIQNYLTQNNKAESQRYLAKFAKLIRWTLESSESDFVPLEEEIKFLEVYLQIEKLRFKEQFDYSVEIDSRLKKDELQIPLFLLQPILENAIWHGIRHMDGEGHIVLVFNSIENGFLAQITDNGVGYSQSISLKKGENKSLGLELIRKRIETLNQLKIMYIEFEITDLKESEGSLRGTKVIFKFYQR